MQTVALGEPLFLNLNVTGAKNLGPVEAISQKLAPLVHPQDALISRPNKPARRKCPVPGDIVGASRHVNLSWILNSTEVSSINMLN